MCVCLSVCRSIYLCDLPHVERGQACFVNIVATAHLALLFKNTT